MISIEWDSKIINVPRNALVSLGNDLYELHIDVFRRELNALQASAAGMAYPDTHNHQAPVPLGGLSLSRVVEIINGYRVVFEDGQYAVNLTGANSNIANVTNVNQVSVRSSNSAGLISSGTDTAAGITLEQAAMLKEVWQLLGLDPDRGVEITDTSRTVADITQRFTETADKTTIERDP